MLKIRSGRPHREGAALADGNRSLIGECARGGEALASLEIEAAFDGIGDEACQCVGIGIQDLRCLPVENDLCAFVVMLPGIWSVPVTL